MRGRADDAESPACAFSPPTSFQRFTDCYKRFYELQPEMTQRIYDKFVTQLQTSIQVSGRNPWSTLGSGPVFRSSAL